VLLRLAYLGATNAFAMLRLLPMSDGDKDAEILALRHQISVLERQPGKERARFTPGDRAFLAALLHRLPSDVLRRVRLLVRPDTVLRWHRDLLARRHAAASQPKRPGRPRTVHSVRALVLRLARENPGWGYRRLHGELLVLGVNVAASTVWEILQQAGIDPAPERASSTWADFLRSQADALLACDFFETVTLSGARMYVVAVIEHASRRIRVLGATAHPTASWVAQFVKNLVMDLEDAGCRVRFLIRDRDGKFPGLFDAILKDAGIEVVLSGVQMPRMNSIMERWVQTCRRELLDRTLIWNHRHLLHALRESGQFCNGHRPHQGIANARPLYPLPAPIANPKQIARLDIRRRERLGGIPPRIRTRRLTCTDEVFGKGSARGRHVMSARGRADEQHRCRVSRRCTQPDQCACDDKLVQALRNRAEKPAGRDNHEANEVRAPGADRFGNPAHGGLGYSAREIHGGDQPSRLATRNVEPLGNGNQCRRDDRAVDRVEARPDEQRRKEAAGERRGLPLAGPCLWNGISHNHRR
jgi:transposase